MSCSKPKTTYAHVEKLCLSLYHTCTMMRHFLLSSTCVVVCQADSIKRVHRPILSGRIRKWGYTIIEYDLSYQSSKTLKCQILADFIVKHRIYKKIKVATLLLLPKIYILMDHLAKKVEALGY